MARLDKDPPERDSNYANTAAVSPADRAGLETPAGEIVSKDPGEATSAFEDEVREKSVGTQPVSSRTDFRLSGTGAIETDDGLDETAEVVREMSEDVPDGTPGEPDRTPIFDRGENL